MIPSQLNREVKRLCIMRLHPLNVCNNDECLLLLYVLNPGDVVSLPDLGNGPVIVLLDQF